MEVIDLETDDVQEPAPKKLRSSEPDLLIVLEYTPDKKEGAKDDDEESDSETESDSDSDSDSDDEEEDDDDESEEGGEEDKKDSGGKKKEDEEEGDKRVRKEYRMYSQVLAKHSKFVDTSLSVGMKEAETKTIVFQDVSPETFERAMSYLEEPCAVKDAKPADILEVVGFYHMYEFAEGLKLADRVLKEYFRKGAGGIPDDLDFLVDAVTVVHKLGLKGAMASAYSRLDSIILFRRRILTENHIAKLQHLFVEKKLCLPGRLEGLSGEELASTLFPKHFVQCVSAFAWLGKPTTLNLRFANYGSFDKYKLKSLRQVWKPESNKPLKGNGRTKIKVTIERVQRHGPGRKKEWLSKEQKDGDWAIFAHPIDDEDDDPPHPAFWAPYSSHWEFPPVSDWKSTKKWTSSSMGNPTLVYYKK